MAEAAEAICEGFETGAVRLVGQAAVSSVKVAADLGVWLSTLARWIGRSHDWADG